MKKKILVIVSVILVVSAIIIELIILGKTKPEEIIPSRGFIYLGTYQRNLNIDNGYIFNNYEDYKNKVISNALTSDDFVNHNYVTIKMFYDECSESDVTPTDYKINGNKIDVNVKYTAKCGVCAPKDMYYLLEVDKSINDAEVNIEYTANNDPGCDPNVTYKPLIYLYPEHKMNVKVTLGYKDLLTVTYPKYNNGWNVIADKDGKLIGEDGRTYYGLYWEGLNHFDSEFKDGFVVKGEDAASFLEEKLEILGLNEMEANEFIIYWLPKLEENEYNLIRFESIEKINEQMPLKVVPTPDTIIRVLMEYKPIKENIQINEQILTKTERKGFSVVEWGGTLIK